MAGFTIRIELHDASESHYQRLHEAMEAGGFSRTIRGSNGKVYQLPTAEYNFVGDGTVKAVRDKASAIAKAVKGRPTPWVLVTQGPRAWSGLEEFEP